MDNQFTGTRWIPRSRIAPKAVAEALTESNADFRRVLYTGHNLQLVLMSLRPGEEIGLETYDDRDQFFRVEAGAGEVLDRWRQDAG